MAQQAMRAPPGPREAQQAMRVPPGPRVEPQAATVPPGLHVAQRGSWEAGLAHQGKTPAEDLQND